MSADSPAGYWRLGESSGSSAADASGHGIGGAYSSGVALGEAGAIAEDGDTAAGFASSGDMVSMGNHFVYAGTSAFSVEAWIKLSSLPAAGVTDVVASNYSGPSGRTGYELSVSAHGFALIRYSGGTPTADTAATPALVANRWYYVVGTYDGSNMSLYVNSVQRQTQADSNSLSSWTGQFTVGNVAWSGEPFAGTIDEVAVYGSALSATQVHTHWVAGLPSAPAMRPEIAADHPVGNWRLNEAAGAIAALDSSGNGIDCSYEYPTTGVAGAISGDSSTAASFNGQGDRVQCGNFLPMPANQPFTVEMWVKPSALSTSNYEDILSKFDFVNGVKTGWALQVNQTYGFTLERWVNNNHTGAASYGHLVVGRWYHVVGTYDGSTTRIYVDGEQGTQTTDTASMPTTTGGLAIGDAYFDTQGGAAFSGTIDEVAVYSSALSLARIRAHYEAFLGANDQPFGVQKRTGLLSSQLDDSTSMGVNLANGALIVQTNDLHLPGVGGHDLSIGRTYNSFDARFSDLNPGWTLTTGRDVRLEVRDDGAIGYDGPTGERVVFTANGSQYTTPPGLDMTLVKYPNTMPGCAGLSSSDTYTLCDNTSNERYEFNASGQLIADETRNTTTANASYTAISYAYNSNGTLASITDTHGGNTSFSYGGWGTISKITDPAGRGYLYGTGSDGNLTEFTDPAGNPTKFVYDSTNALTQIVDPNGVATDITYDANGRVATIVRGVDPASGACLISGESTCPTTGFAYNSDNTVVTDPNNHVWTYNYDSLDRITKITDPLGRATSQTYTANDDIASSTNTVNGVTDNTYDGSNNLTKVQGPAPSGSPRMTSTNAFGDSANPYSSTGLVDEQGNSWNAAYDGNGNLCAKSEGTTSATLACSGGSGEGKNQMFFTYTNGLLTQAKDGNGNTYSYSYDPTSHDQTGITNPSPLGSESMSYDSLNRLASYTDGRSKTTSYSYDGTNTTSLDRLTKITYADGSSVSYGYDDNGNLTSETDKDPGGTTTASVTYSSDALNRLTSEAQPNGTVTYTYTPGGQLDTVTENGLQTKYYYDKANRLAAIDEPGVTANSACSSSYPGATICLGYSETPGSGSQSVITYPGGATVTSNYDTAGRLTSILNKNGAGTTVASYAYTYAYNSGAADGALRQSVTPLGGGAQYYCYDPTGRLASAGSTTLSCPSTPAANGSWADPNAPYQYVYDANGNMTSKTINGTTTIYTVNGANELTNGGYSFDGEGNQLSSPTIASLQYNDADQTTSITPTTTALTASYVGNGQTNRTSFAGNSFLNDQQGTARFTSGSTNTDFSNDPAGTTYSENVGGSHYYFAFDGLGSVVGLFDSSGSYVSSWTASYDPYGTLTNTIPSGYPQFNIRYAGYWYDTQTGLYKAGQRYYDPTTGRWTQRDPIDNPTDLTGWNRYDYAADDPINLTDPSGLCAWYDVVCHATTFARGVSRDWRDFTVGTLGFIGAGALYAVGAIATGACFDATEGLDSIDCVKIGGMFASLGNASGAIGVYEYGRVYRAGKRRRRR